MAVKALFIETVAVAVDQFSDVMKPVLLYWEAAAGAREVGDERAFWCSCFIYFWKQGGFLQMSKPLVLLHIWAWWQLQGGDYLSQLGQKS